jgi:hypothetical protein
VAPHVCPSGYDSGGHLGELGDIAVGDANREVARWDLDCRRSAVRGDSRLASDGVASPGAFGRSHRVTRSAAEPPSPAARNHPEQRLGSRCGPAEHEAVGLLPGIGEGESVTRNAET